MARNRSRGSGGGDTSRQKDREQEPVNFEDDEAIYVDKPDGNNFISLVRTKVIGKDSGNLKSEFVKIQQGFYGEGGKPFYPKKENMKWPTTPPSGIPELIFGLEDLLTDEEYDAYEKQREKLEAKDD